MKEIQKGKFIVIEGLDGSGKTVQAQMLANRLSAQFLPVYQTVECSLGPIGQVIRHVYLSGEREADPRITNLLYAVDRLDHITNKEDGMLWKVNDGINVICDRYYLSSVAYYAQEFYGSTKYDEQMRSIIEQNRMNFELMTPDATVFIDVPTDECYRRIAARNEKREIYEYQDKLRKISESYKIGMDMVREINHEEFIMVDGVGGIDEVSERVWDVVKHLFQAK